MTCSTDGNSTMTFTTTVVYSTESGDMTASTLIRMFQDRAASTSTVIFAGSQTATIVSVCNPFCTPEAQPSLTSTPELQEMMEQIHQHLCVHTWEDLLPVSLSSSLQQSLFGKPA